jgi:two-component system, OmpR family, KDP operon response regulator KdpE
MSTTRPKACKARILVVAREPQIQKLLKSIFTAIGYAAFFAEEVAAALPAYTEFRPDLVVLDLDLSDLGDRDPILEIRRRSDVPLVALSSRQTEVYLVAAFDRGADDYVEKPFRVGELLARIRSLLRRDLKTKGQEALYHCGTLDIDVLDHSVRRGGELVRLKPSEFEILSLLVRNSGRVVSYQRFLKSPSGGADCRSKQALRTSVCSLRQKIEDDPSNPKIILTVERIGYRLARSADRATRASSMEEESEGNSSRG